MLPTQIVSLLDTSEECPDDFTTIRRLYLPFYPCNLSDWLAAEATSSVQGPPTNSLPPEQRASIGHRLAHQLLSALDFLHSRNIFHRDVKPANILLTHMQVLPLNDFEVRLCDFGTAWHKTQGDHGSARPQTCSTSTHPYTPPEMLFSPVDGYDGAKVDLWELACVIAELFTPVVALQGEAQTEQKPPLSSTWAPFASHPPSDFLTAGPTSRPRMLFSDKDNGEEDEDAFWRSEEKSIFGQSETSPFGEAKPKSNDSRPKKILPAPTSSGPTLQGPLSSGFEPSNLSATTQSPTHSHESLFRGQQGDLGLASDIFEFLGLPGASQSETEWPEALRFRPPLERFPFPRRPPPDLRSELRRRLPLLYAASGVAAFTPEAKALEETLVNIWKLSASQRWTARQALSHLAQTSSNP